MRYTIRAAAEDDITRILEIEHESITPPWTHGGLLGEIYNGDSFFALALDGKMIMGFIILRRAADEGELYQIAVDRARRRQGVADALMKAALEWARDCGINAIYLEVRKSNEAAVKLYQKHGFKKKGRRKDYYAEPAEDAAIMAWGK